jgi:hypothetical protein
LRDLKLPKGLRYLFKRPFGKVFKGEDLKPAEEIKRLIKDERIIAVGDITLKNMLKVGVKPDLCIVDFKTKREIERKITFNKAVKVINPAGTITKELWMAIRGSVETTDASIIVEGEEDLAVLPCIIEAELGTIVLYGQPDEGIVFVKVTEKKKEEAESMLRLMEEMQ